MPAGAGAITRAQATQPDAELRVVVDGLDVERRGELLLRGREATAPEIRAREGLTHRSLRGLERPRLLQRDHRRMGVVVCEEPHALGEGGVCLVLA